MTHERPPYLATEIDKANAHLESLIRVLRTSSSQEEIRLRAENEKQRAVIDELIRDVERLRHV